MVTKKSKGKQAKINNGRKPQVTFVAPNQLTPNPANPRRHDRAQIRAIARSIQTFGFTAPILIDQDNRIIAGEARWSAAEHLGLSTVSVMRLEHLTDVQVKAYMLADNQLAARSTWDDEALAKQLKELSELVLDFEIDAIGFEVPEIDFRIQSLEAAEAADIADEFPMAAGPPVSHVGDLWRLDPHRLSCGNSLDTNVYATLMEGERAAGAFTDPPYNVKIDSHVCGKGRIRHREFAMASGEMTKADFTGFLSASIASICTHSVPGAIAYVCMDWRHIEEILAAGQSSQCELLNVCVWAKSNGGMGSLYRSRHEFVFVFRNGKEAHLNNVQLGRFGRNRTNVWNYPGVNTFAGKSSRRGLDLHPTVKPIALVADAILDSTQRGDIILDPFVGSGTSILAAERTGRRCYGIELDPLYVDTAVERWQRMSKRQAKSSHGETFAEVKSRRRSDA
jgi:DNA modification methylase